MSYQRFLQWQKPNFSPKKSIFRPLPETTMTTLDIIKRSEILKQLWMQICPWIVMTCKNSCNKLNLSFPSKDADILLKNKQVKWQPIKNSVLSEIVKIVQLRGHRKKSISIKNLRSKIGNTVRSRIGLKSLMLVVNHLRNSVLIRRQNLTCSHRWIEPQKPRFSTSSASVFHLLTKQP